MKCASYPREMRVIFFPFFRASFTNDARASIRDSTGARDITIRKKQDEDRRAQNSAF